MTSFRGREMRLAWGLLEGDELPEEASGSGGGWDGMDSGVFPARAGSSTMASARLPAPLPNSFLRILNILPGCNFDSTVTFHLHIRRRAIPPNQPRLLFDRQALFM